MRKTKRNIAHKPKASKLKAAKPNRIPVTQTEPFASAKGHTIHSESTEPFGLAQPQGQPDASEAMRPSPQGVTIDSPGRQTGESIAKRSGSMEQTHSADAPPSGHTVPVNRTVPTTATVPSPQQAAHSKTDPWSLIPDPGAIGAPGFVPSDETNHAIASSSSH